MYSVMAIWGAGMLLAGIYCVSLTNKSDYGWLCCILGVVMIVVGLVIPIMGAIACFEEKDVFGGIFSIVLYVASLVCSIFYVRNLIKF